MKKKEEKGKDSEENEKDKKMNRRKKGARLLEYLLRYEDQAQRITDVMEYNIDNNIMLLLIYSVWFFVLCVCSVFLFLFSGFPL